MNKISVIIPTYNNAQYLDDAIASIIKQSYQNIEIIVVDDGSTDNTKDVVTNYDKLIKYIYQKNQGIAVARNTGILFATGEWFTFLDGDDVWEPDNLRAKMGILNKDQTIDAVFSDFILFNDDGIIRKSGIKFQYPIFFERRMTFDLIFQHKEKLKLHEHEEIDVYKGNIFNSLLFGNFINACSIIIKKKSQEAIGLFKPELRTQQDYEYWLRFFKSHKVAYIDLPLVKYRRHPKQLTAHRNSAKIINTVANILEPYYKDKDNIIPNHLITLFTRRYSNIFKQLGFAYLGNKENKKARKSFKTGFLIDKKNILLLFYWLFTFLPFKITNDTTRYLLRKIKGKNKS